MTRELFNGTVSGWYIPIRLSFRLYYGLCYWFCVSYAWYSLLEQINKTQGGKRQMTALLIYLILSGICFPITLGFMISYIKKYKNIYQMSLTELNKALNDSRKED